MKKNNFYRSFSISAREQCTEEKIYKNKKTIQIGTVKDKKIKMGKKITIYKKPEFKIVRSKTRTGIDTAFSSKIFMNGKRLYGVKSINYKLEANSLHPITIEFFGSLEICEE